MSRKALYILLAALLIVLAGLVIVGIYYGITAAQEQGVIDITYTFEGNHADTAGFAEGTITLSPAHEDAATSGYYLLYFADNKGLLEGYDEFASVPITGDTVTHTVKNGTLLPPAATKLAVFESDAPFLDEQPAYDTRAAVIKLPAEKRIKLDDATFTFGAVSDVHMNYEAHNRGAYQKWADALDFFAAEEVDKLIVAGDMTGDEFEGALVSQYQKYIDIINASAYPLEDVHECIGNHGNTAVGRETFVEMTRGEGEERPVEDTPWYSVLVEGEDDARDNLFLFMAQELRAPGDSASYDNFSEEQIDWLEEMLTTYDGTDTNIFIVEHSPFLNYGPGDRHGGDYTTMVSFKFYYLQNMRLKNLLEAHKDVILLSGHTHLSLYDGENYGDEDGTSCRMIHVGSTCRPTTYQNAEGTLQGGDGRHAVSPTYGSEGYTVAVYDDYIIFTGRNLSTNTIIPSACYILPITV